MKHYCLLLIIFLSDIILLECMIFTSSYFLSNLPHRLFRECSTLVRHVIKFCYNVIFTYLFQHSCNEQNITTGNHTDLQLTNYKSDIWLENKAMPGLKINIFH